MILVIGYGNELRGDDTVGLRVAEALAARELPGARVLAVHQLTPELAEAVSHAAAVIFVDAAMGGAAGQVDVLPCMPVDLGRPLDHVGDPDSLLALTQAVFGRAPSAWMVTVQVESMELGRPVSAAAEGGVRAAVDVIGKLICQLGESGLPSSRAQHGADDGRERDESP